MKRISLTVFIGFTALNSSILRAEDVVWREVVVETMRDSLCLPPGQDSATLAEMTYISDSLEVILTSHNAELIAKSVPGFDPADTLGIVEYTGDTVRLADFSQVYDIRFPPGSNIANLVEILSKVPEVIYAEPNGKAMPCYIWPNDPYFHPPGPVQLGDTIQWGLYNPDTLSDYELDADIDAAEPDTIGAWDIYTGSEATKIGILDTGVELDHIDLVGRVSGDTSTVGWGNWHGTHVAGIVGAITDNGIGIAGVDWKAQLVSREIEGGKDIGEIAMKVRQASIDDGCQILNCSFSLQDPDDPLKPYYSITVRRAFADTYKLNRAAVASIGNDKGYVTNYPAGFGQGIIAVGALEPDGTHWSLSSKGPHIDVSAPGTRIFSTYSNNTFRYGNGTSCAAPFVSGEAGLIRGLFEDLYSSPPFNDDLEQVIRLSADDIAAPGFEDSTGTGRINARQALQLISSPNIVSHQEVVGGEMVDSSEVYHMTFFDTPGLTGKHLVRRYEVVRWVDLPFWPHPIAAWGDGVHTRGYSIGEVHKKGETEDTLYYGMNWCEVIPGSLVAGGCSLRTYVYKVRVDEETPRQSPYDSFPGVPTWVWAPCQPESVRYAFTVILSPYETPRSSGGPHSFDSGAPSKIFIFHQGMPNPFYNTILLGYELPERSRVRLSAYDATGRLVRGLVDQEQGPGAFKLGWDGRDNKGRRLPAGVYFLRLEAAAYKAIQKVVLMR